jgi:hypothetical protein
MNDDYSASSPGGSGWGIRAPRERPQPAWDAPPLSVPAQAQVPAPGPAPAAYQPDAQYQPYPGQVQPSPLAPPGPGGGQMAAALVFGLAGAVGLIGAGIAFLYWSGHGSALGGYQSGRVAGLGTRYALLGLLAITCAVRGWHVLTTRRMVTGALASVLIVLPLVAGDAATLQAYVGTGAPRATAAPSPARDDAAVAHAVVLQDGQVPGYTHISDQPAAGPSSCGNAAHAVHTASIASRFGNGRDAIIDTVTVASTAPAMKAEVALYGNAEAQQCYTSSDLPTEVAVGKLYYNGVKSSGPAPVALPAGVSGSGTRFILTVSDQVGNPGQVTMDSYWIGAGRIQAHLEFLNAYPDAAGQQQVLNVTAKRLIAQSKA